MFSVAATRNVQRLARNRVVHWPVAWAHGVASAARGSALRTDDTGRWGLAHCRSQTRVLGAGGGPQRGHSTTGNYATYAADASAARTEQVSSLLHQRRVLSALPPD